MKEAGRSHSTLRKRIKRDRKKTSGAPGGPRKGLFGSLATEVHGYKGRLFVGAAMREEPRVSLMDEDRQVRVHILEPSKMRIRSEGCVVLEDARLGDSPRVRVYD